MIRRGLLVLMLLFALALFAKVRVLSVCVGSYPEDSGWGNLSARNDNRMVCDIFPDAVSLIDAAATRRAFDQGLADLERSANAGDTVIIHFSGHGQQILTPSSDLEDDLVDESMVPYDAQKHESSAYHGENHFTDDAFGARVDEIRGKIGSAGLVIAVIDACHSDSMDKDADESDDVYRGTDEIFGAGNLSADSIQILRERYYTNDMTAILPSDSSAEVIFIAACSAQQRNYEIKKAGQAFGSLSYYFCKAVGETGLTDTAVLLDTLYSMMTADSIMLFHKQCPSIRASFGWEPPASDYYIPPVCVNTDNEQVASSSDWTLWIVVGFSVVVMTLIILVVWRRKR